MFFLLQLTNPFTIGVDKINQKRTENYLLQRVFQARYRR